MIRLLLLFALAVAPLVASAHDGRHAPAQDGVGIESNVTANGTIVAIASAASRCPDGGHDSCCCRDGWCTTTSASVAVIDAPWRERWIAGAEPRVALSSDPALPSAAPLPFPARGPPLRS